ncbi:hypothetical protein [Burkholderia ubonensis]|uniref:hypothetical protein n=1 Tax=Burkholderia ubonensis TaxID=101571 RepID=UPI0018DF61C9|nr:hypothetical protein [Burkholderia ubonensis]
MPGASAHALVASATAAIAARERQDRQIAATPRIVRRQRGMRGTFRCVGENIVSFPKLCGSPRIAARSGFTLSRAARDASPRVHPSLRFIPVDPS